MAESIYDKQGTTLIVCLQGKLDAVTSPALETELQQHLDGIRDIVMDFACVENISSGGIRMMLATKQLLDDRSGRMKVIHVNAYVLEVFDIVGFMDVVDVIRD